MPENGGEYVLVIENGCATLVPDGDTDVTISLDVSEFSSLATGAIGFRKLYQYGLAMISDATYLDTVDRLFHTDQPPLCMTHF